MKSGSRAAKPGREAKLRRDGAIAVVFMVASSSPEICACEVCDLARNGYFDLSVTSHGTKT
jgi:hypothetical protein